MSRIEKAEENIFITGKVQIPEPVKNAVERTGLISRLEQSDEEVVVFQAAAGFGKTTAMAELARRHDGCCAWYRIEESDNEPECFLRGIAASVSRIIRINLDESEEDGQKNEDIAKAYHRFLSSFLLGLWDESFYICLDDFQMISNDIVYKWMEKLIEYGNAKIRLFLTVKGSLPEFLAVYLMQGRLRIIHAEDLRFERNETKLLLKQITGMKLSHKLIQEIQDYTRGWPAGIVFAGLGLRDEKVEKQLPHLLHQAHLYDYIFYEIFRKFSDNVQRFLIETSIFEEMDTILCDHVLERSDSKHLLEYLIREEFFLSRVEGKRDHYFYHPVFAGFLRSRLQQERKEEILLRVMEKQEEEKGLLQVRCLGNFSVEGAGGMVNWRTRKTKELFACLFFEEGRGVSKDILLERLWPEYDREKATVIFHTTVSYLRKALITVGAEKMLIVSNQAYALYISGIRSDFEKLMEWKHYAEEGSIPAGKKVEEVVELYHEGYMCGEDYIWLGEHRQYVEKIFLQTMERLARIQMEEEEYREATLCLAKAVEVDCYELSLFELLVECLILTGDVKGAKRQYEKMNRISQEELDQKSEGSFKDYIIRAGLRQRSRKC